jgi:hypothetical protein
VAIGGLLTHGGDDIILEELQAKVLLDCCVGPTLAALFERRFPPLRRYYDAFLQMSVVLRVKS